MDDFFEEPVVRRSTKVIAWIVTLLVLGGVWGIVAMNLPERVIHTGVAESGAASTPVTAGAQTLKREPTPISQSLDNTMPATESPIPAVQAESLRTATEPHPPSGTPAPIGSQQSAISSDQGSGAASSMRGADCRSEVEQLCPSDVGPDGRRRCVQMNEPSLPAPCRQGLAQRLVRVRGDPEEMKLACEADVRRFCRNVTSGRMPILQCLRVHARDLSDDCRRLLSWPVGRM